MDNHISLYPAIIRQTGVLWGVTGIWLVMVLAQALTGLMQLHGRTASHHYLFNITGTFHNPGPFAGFIVSALPLALGVILALKQLEFPGTGYRGFRILGRPLGLKERGFYLQKAMIFLCYVVIITLVLVIPAARSRAAWIAGAAGCAYLLLKHPAIAGYRKKVIGLFSRISFFTRLTVIIFAFILLLPAGMSLYLMKQGSASGRVLMWKVTWELFSYPFDISSFILQLAVVTALLGGFSKTAFVIAPWKLSALRPGLLFACVFLALTASFVPRRVNHYEALKTWRNAERLYNFRSYNASVIEYEKAFPVLPGNGLFLQMYGKALSMDEQHKESIGILNLAANLYNSHILQNTLGDSHKALGNFKAAEAAYIKSSHMMPSMLLPRYLLAKLYNESGQNEKARQTAEELLSSPVKVESSATREIISEMEKLINESPLEESETD